MNYIIHNLEIKLLSLDNHLKNEGESMKISDYINGLKIGDGFIYRNCLLFPVTVEEELNFSLLTLDDAVDKSAVQVEELPRSRVSSVRVTNKTDSPLFLMDGEMLIGALQTRVVNTSLIIDSLQVVEIPVACVESGRWAGKTKSFQTAKTCAIPSVRKSVLTNMIRTESFESNQEEVWTTVGETLTTYKVVSSTSSLHHLYTSPTVERFMPEEDEVKALYTFHGVVCAVNGDMFFDIFSSKELFKKIARKLIGSYVVEAMSKKGGIHAKPSDVEKFVEYIMNSHGKKVDSPTGVGFEIRVSTASSMGKALVYNDKVVHFNGFFVKS